MRRRLSQANPDCDGRALPASRQVFRFLAGMRMIGLLTVVFTLALMVELGIWGLAIAADAGEVEGVLKIEGLVEMKKCCQSRRRDYRVAGVALCGGSAVGEL